MGITAGSNSVDSNIVMRILVHQRTATMVNHKCSHSNLSMAGAMEAREGILPTMVVERIRVS